MGSNFDSCDEAMGAAYYMGANSSWEVIWLLLSIVMCVIALWMGARHELDAYKEAENDK